MADITIAFVAPFAMTAKALPVEGAFETRLSQVGGVGWAPMALTAGEDTARRVVVVANRASRAHDFHIGMKFVGEGYRLVYGHQFIEFNYIGDTCGRGWNFRDFRGAFTGT
jgi:hypothetical protein